MSAWKTAYTYVYDDVSLNALKDDFQAILIVYWVAFFI